MKYIEDQHQMNLIKWTQQPHIREKWPELKLLYHVANERQCDPRMGKKLRLMGVRRGVPDLCLPVARGVYHGLYIEMKAESGSLTEEQKWWRDQLIKQKFFWSLCRGWESAAQILEWYMSLPAGDADERAE